ncbi:MAG: polysaccharide biosynthesis C-terminal domain-containing protein, partial [Bdellovibrionales bacterium]|nr:polysaccharide biosynthesis C-terminal domain-containing protein [Bdellovibrionales bacterium]
IFYLLSLWGNTSGDFQPSFPIFVVLCIGIFIGSGFIPFDTTLFQGGYPGTYSLYVLAIVLCNVALNYLMIPHFGAMGAALATSTSYVISAVLVVFCFYKVLQIPIFANILRS